MQYYCLGEMPRLNEGGLDMIRQWIKSVEHPRLVVIDTFVTVRALKRGNQPSYDADYESGKELQKLANEYGVAVVIVHHQRKMEADDVFDTVSGTLGLTGAVDTILVLKRDNSGTIILHGRGRDLAGLEKVVTFNKDACTWTIIGDASKAKITSERQAILDAIEEMGGSAKPTEIASMTGMKAVNIRRMVIKMAVAGQLKKGDYGKYEIVKNFLPAEEQI